MAQCQMAKMCNLLVESFVHQVKTMLRYTPVCGNLPVKLLKKEYLCDKQQLKFEKCVVRTATCLIVLCGKTTSNGLDKYGDRKKKYSTMQMYQLHNQR